MSFTELIYVSTMRGEAQVLETYARIYADQRHHHISRLSVSIVPLRRFEKWSMGFKHLSEAELAT